MCEKPSEDDGVSLPMSSAPPHVVFIGAAAEEMTTVRLCHDAMRTGNTDRQSTARVFGGGPTRRANEGVP